MKKLLNFTRFWAQNGKKYPNISIIGNIEVSDLDI